MADQDFFLRFGSNAEDFAKDVRSEIGGARRELDQLSKAIQNLNQASAGSPTAKLVSGIRDDIKSAMGDVAKTIGQELRSALRGELKSLNLGDISISADVGSGGSRSSGRVSSLDVTDEQKKSAEQIRKAASGTADELDRALTDGEKKIEAAIKSGAAAFDRIETASKDVGAEGRAALAALSIAMSTLKRDSEKLLGESKALKAAASRAGDKPSPHRGKGIPSDEKARLAKAGNQKALKAQHFDRDFNAVSAAVDELAQGTRTAKSAINRAIEALGRVDPEMARVTAGLVRPSEVESARPTQPAAPVAPAASAGDDVLSDRFVAAGNLMVSGAQNMNEAVAAFKAHIDAFKAAAQNLKVSGGGDGREFVPKGKRTNQGVDQGLEAATETLLAGGDISEPEKKKRAKAAKDIEDRGDSEREVTKVNKKIVGDTKRTLAALQAAPKADAAVKESRKAAGRFGLPDFSKLPFAALAFTDEASGGFDSRPSNKPKSNETKTREQVRFSRNEGEVVEIDSASIEKAISSLERSQELLRNQIDRLTEQVSSDFLSEDSDDGELQRVRENISQLQGALSKTAQNIDALEAQRSGGKDPETTRQAKAVAEVVAFQRKQEASISQIVRTAVQDGLGLDQIDTLLSDTDLDLDEPIRRGVSERLAKVDDLVRGGLDKNELTEAIRHGIGPAELFQEAGDGNARQAAIARAEERDIRNANKRKQQQFAEQAATASGRLGELGLDTQTRSAINALTTAIPVQFSKAQQALTDTNRTISKLQRSLEGLKKTDPRRAALEDTLAVATTRANRISQRLESGGADERLLRIPGTSLVDDGEGNKVVSGKPAISLKDRDELAKRVAREARSEGRELNNPKQVAGQIADLLESTSREAINALQGVNRLADAANAAAAVEEARGRGDVDEQTLDKQERSAAAAMKRVEKEFKEFGGPLKRLRELLDFMSVGNPLPGQEDIFQGRSMQDLILGGGKNVDTFTSAQMSESQAERAAAEAAYARAARSEGLEGGLTGLRKARDEGVLTEDEYLEATKRAKAEIDDAVTAWRSLQERMAAANRTAELYEETLETLARLRLPPSDTVDRDLVEKRLAAQPELKAQTGTQRSLNALTEAARKQIDTGEKVDFKEFSTAIEALGGYAGMIEKTAERRPDDKEFEALRRKNAEAEARLAEVRATFPQVGPGRDGKPLAKPTMIRGGTKEDPKMIPMSAQQEAEKKAKRGAAENLIEEEIAARIKAEERLVARRKQHEKDVSELRRALIRGDLSPFISTLESEAKSTMPGAQRAVRLREIGLEAGLSPKQVKDVSTVEELQAVIAPLKATAQSLDEVKAAADNNTKALRQQEKDLRRASIATDADQRLSALGTQDRASVAEFFAGGKVPDSKPGRVPLENLGIRAGNFANKTLDEIFDKAEQNIDPQALAKARKEVDRLSEALKTFTSSTLKQSQERQLKAAKSDVRRLESAGGTRSVLASVAGVEAPKVADKELLAQARLARDGLVKSSSENKAALEEIERRANSDVNGRLISTLSELSAAINQLSACCKAMQTGLVGGGFADDVSRERALGNVPPVIAQIQSAMVEAIRKAAASTGQDRQRALGDAAAIAKSDANVSAVLSDSEIIGAVQGMLRGVGGKNQAMSGVDVAAIEKSLLRFTAIQEAVGKEGVEEFNAGDVDALAKRLIEKTRDVDGSLRLLTQAFGLSSDEVDQFRVGLEQMKAALPERLSEGAAASPEATALEQRVREGRLVGVGLDPSSVDLSDRSVDAVKRVATAFAQAQPEMLSVEKIAGELARVYGTLEAEHQEMINTLVLETNAARQAAQSNEAVARSIASGLPEGDRAAFLSSVDGTQSGPLAQGQAIEMVSKAGGGINATLEDTISRLYRGEGVPKQGREAADKFARAGMATLTTYQTPFQALIKGLFRGQSILQSTLATAGNYVSRFLGGSIVFGAVNQFQEFGRIALETEQTFIRIEAALEATGRSADGVRGKLQDIAVSTNVALDDTYEVAAQLVGVFDDIEEALKATEVVNQLEMISQGALNAREGFRSLSAVTAAFQDELVGRGFSDTDAIGYVADLAVRLQDLTGVNIEDTTEGLARLGETAISLGIEMELIASAVGQTAKASGQTGQAASEQIGRILANFQSGDVQSTLIDLGITDKDTVRAGEFGQVFKDLLENYSQLASDGDRRQIANLIGDPRQFALTNALLSNGAETLEVYEQSFNNTGAAADRTKDILGTLRGQMGQMNKELQVFVQLVIDLGLLAVFERILFVLDPIVGGINQILQVFVRIKESNPFADIVLQVGAAVLGFKTLLALAEGATVQFAAMAGASAQQGGVFGVTYEAVQESRAKRKEERDLRRGRTPGFVPPAPHPHPGYEQGPTGRFVARQYPPASAPVPRRSFYQRSPILRGIGSAASTVAETAAYGKASDRLKKDMVELKTRYGGVATASKKFRSNLSAMAPEMIAGAIAIAFLVDMITKKGNEAQEYYQNIAPVASTATQQKDGESEEEFADRSAREAADASTQAITQLEGQGWEEFTNRLGLVGEALKFATSNVENLWSVLIAAPRGWANFFSGGALGPSKISDALSGSIPEGNEILNDFTGRLPALRDVAGAGNIDLINQEKVFLQDKFATLIAEAPTAAVAEAYTELYESLDRNLDALLDVALEVATGAKSELDLTVAELNAAYSIFQQTANFEMADFGKYGEDIRSIFGGASVNVKEAVEGLFSGEGSLESRSAVIDTLLDEARYNLHKLENDDTASVEEKEAARQALGQVLQARIDLDREAMAQAIDLPIQFSEIAVRSGDYARAEGLLTSALAAIRQKRSEVRPGSAEDAALIQQEYEVLRKKADASIAEDVDTLELAAIGMKDPIQTLGNSLQTVRLKLQSSIDNPGAYTAEEIRAFVREIAELQQQIADEQENIADALDAYNASAANNDLARSSIEYQSALRRYRTAIDTDAGAAAVLEAATEVNEAARAQRKAAEDLRAARAQTDISSLPTGDTLRIALAQLTDAFSRQAFIIQEFGRNSVEFQNSIDEIIGLQREAEQAAREASDAALGLAISLANAAGLDVRSSRLQLQQAQAELQRALSDSGGNLDAAAVQNAAAAVVDAQAGVRDTILGEALSTVDFMLTMEEITEQQAVQVLTQILETADLTENQRRDLMTRIKGLKDAINDGVSEQFNLGDIRIPTPFEVRRALKVEELTQGLQDSVDAVLDPVTTAADRIPAAPEGLLESILGPDLASEVLSLGANGGNISEEIRKIGDGIPGDLLPPLERIPDMINEQLLTREEISVRAQQQIEMLVLNREMQNLAISQIAPEIGVPMAMILEAEEQANLLTEQTNELLALSLDHLSSMRDLLALEETGPVVYDTYQPGNYNENDQRAIENAIRNNAPSTAQLSAAGLSPQSTTNNNQSTTVVYNDNRQAHIDGTDTRMVERQIEKTMGRTAIQREGVNTTAGRRVR